MPKIIFIAAVAKENRVIGNQGKLPRHIPEDFAWFKKNTLGKIIIMGRKTFESLGKPLPNRRNIVLTSKKIEVVECFQDIQIMLEVLKYEKELWIIGGSQIFEAFLPTADELYITWVEGNYEGDTIFPLFETDFEKVWAEPYEGFEFCIYERIDS